MKEARGYALREFAEMIGGELLREGSDARVEVLVTDSRNYSGRPHAVFFALRGPRNDGHAFIEAAAAAGMGAFVVSDPDAAAQAPEAGMILVRDTTEALQKAGAAHRARFNPELIAVTGSNGKTVVKEWLYQLLQKSRHVLRSPRSYNSQIGVPLSAWLLEAGHETAVFEAGISKPGEMAELEKIIAPDVGVFTNIGDAHSENFKDIDLKIDEKLKLFTSAKKVIYCRDHDEIHRRIRAAFAEKGPELRDWSFKDPDAALYISADPADDDHTVLNCTYAGKKFTVSLPFTDAASAENAGHCILYLLDAGHAPEAISEGIAALTPIAMRLEQLEGINGCTLINDAYNSDLNSLEIALDQLKLQRKNKKFIAVLSDFAQSGEPPDVLCAKTAELLRLKKIDRLEAVGPELSAHREAFGDTEARFYASTEDFLSKFRHDDYRGANVLVKGARAFGFERVASILSEKTHETILEIDLERLRDNLDYIRSLLREETKIMVMVKAFAYGSGAYEIARTLEHYRVAYLAVAYADEGIGLREAGITAPIMVLNPEISTYDAMIRYRLEPQIFSFLTLEKFTAALFARDSEWPYPIHIKVNTGMNRLGFDLGEMHRLGELLASRDAVKTVSVFTHLAGSEAERFDALTEKQAERYAEACAALNRHIAPDYMRHMLNSQGVFRHGKYQYDMVRMGLALYGISGNPEFRKHLRPVSRLITTVSQVRKVAAGEGVGYSPKEMLRRDTEVAVVPVGYADGLPRTLGNGKGHMIIRGKRVPTLGNICMDMTMLDVTGIGCQEGDKAEVFGDRADIYEMAKNLNTIPYEVLTNISRRVKRVYLHA